MTALDNSCGPQAMSFAMKTLISTGDVKQLIIKHMKPKNCRADRSKRKLGGGIKLEEMSGLFIIYVVAGCVLGIHSSRVSSNKLLRTKSNDGGEQGSAWLRPDAELNFETELEESKHTIPLMHLVSNKQKL